MKDKHYQFDLDRMRDYFVFWNSGHPALLLEGDPAAGKTSWIEQVHNRLNVPLYVVPCTPTTDAQQLYGQYLPKEGGGLHWVDGPVTRACREGTSVLLDEGNTLDPGVFLGLNAVLERKSYTLAETGEVITPKPTSRFFVAQNSVDSRLMMAGRNVQDTSNNDRFMYLEVDYLKPEVEKRIVESVLIEKGCEAKQSALFANVVVDVANSVRAAYRAGEENIDMPLSTRVIIRWAIFAYMYQPGLQAKKVSALHYSLGRSVKMSREMLLACKNMLTAKTGTQEQLS